MSKSEINQIRNVGVVAHGGGGATSLIEGLLFNGKEIKELGTPDKGNMAMMSEQEEIEKLITITPHTGYFKWQDTLINVTDCPGYVNFLESTKGALSAMDSSIIIFNDGVKAESERLWK